MKSGKILRILTVAILLSLLLAVLPGESALAAPVLNVSPASGAVGTLVTVTGENFDSYKGDDISLFFDSEEITTSPLVVPDTGSFSFDFNIPGGAEPGRHWVRAKGELSSALAVTLFMVPEAEINLSIGAGTVGIEVTIEGEGFYVDKVVTFYYDNRTREMLGTEVTTPGGEFTYSFVIPDSVAGQHEITAENAEGNSAEAEFEVIPSIALNPVSGAAGNILTVSGKGFGPRSDVAIYFKSDEMAYARTNAYGSFQVAYFNVPSIMPGSYDVKVEDEDDNMAKAEFTVVAGANLDKTTVSVGEDLIISGTGFIVGGDITIEYDLKEIATVKADGNGAFRALLRVPISKYGEHLITVNDGESTRQLVFAIESDPPLAPTPLLPKDNREVKAVAYFDWEDVDDFSRPVIYYLQIAMDENFTSLVLERELTESAYALAGDERLAAVKKGASYYWRVKAIDGAGNESEWSTRESFYVAAPPAPKLVLPESDIKAEAETYFDWKDVTSLSPPITYHLQLASDKDFASLVLEKKGLIKSEYTVLEEEKLAAVKKEVPYYWRVKAVDGAANESEWSTPGSFYVGFSLALPGWLIYTLIGLGAVIVGFLAFWIGRRTAYYYQS